MFKKTLLSALFVTTIAAGILVVGPLAQPASAAPAVSAQAFAQVITLPTFFNGYSLPYSPGYTYVYDNTWITISSTGK